MSEDAEDPVRWSSGGGPPGSADFLAHVERPVPMPPALRTSVRGRLSRGIAPPAAPRWIAPATLATAVVVGGIVLWLLHPPEHTPEVAITPAPELVDAVPEVTAPEVIEEVGVSPPNHVEPAESLDDDTPPPSALDGLAPRGEEPGEPDEARPVADPGTVDGALDPWGGPPIPVPPSGSGGEVTDPFEGRHEVPPSTDDGANGPSSYDLARAAAIAGNHRDVVRILLGHARTREHYELLIESLRIISGMEPQVARSMHEYLERWPDGPRARSYETYLTTRGE